MPLRLKNERFGLLGSLSSRIAVVAVLVIAIFSTQALALPDNPISSGIGFNFGRFGLEPSIGEDNKPWRYLGFGFDIRLGRSITFGTRSDLLSHIDSQNRTKIFDGNRNKRYTAGVSWSQMVDNKRAAVEFHVIYFHETSKFEHEGILYEAMTHRFGPALALNLKPKPGGSFLIPGWRFLAGYLAGNNSSLKNSAGDPLFENGKRVYVVGSSYYFRIELVFEGFWG